MQRSESTKENFVTEQKESCRESSRAFTFRFEPIAHRGSSNNRFSPYTYVNYHYRERERGGGEGGSTYWNSYSYFFWHGIRSQSAFPQHYSYYRRIMEISSRVYVSSRSSLFMCSNTHGWISRGKHPVTRNGDMCVWQTRTNSLRISTSNIDIGRLEIEKNSDRKNTKTSYSSCIKCMRYIQR